MGHGVDISILCIGYPGINRARELGHCQADLVGTLEPLNLLVSSDEVDQLIHIPRYTPSTTELAKSNAEPVLPFRSNSSIDSWCSMIWSINPITMTVRRSSGVIVRCCHGRRGRRIVLLLLVETLRHPRLHANFTVLSTQLLTAPLEFVRPFHKSCRLMREVYDPLRAAPNGGTMRRTSLMSAPPPGHN